MLSREQLLSLVQQDVVQADPLAQYDEQTQQNLKVLQEVAEELMRTWQVPSDWQFKWFQRHRQCGYCDYRKKTISLSVIHAVTNPITDVLDTIKHEIAHALTPNCGHDVTWRAMAVKIGATPRSCYDPRRSHGGESLGAISKRSE